MQNNTAIAAFIQELPTLVIATITMICMTTLLILHIIATADATPIFYVVISYFLMNGSARLVVNKQQPPSGTGVP